MHFVVDRVSDYSFYENVLLGLADSLRKCVGVTKTFVKNLPPPLQSEILEWEETHGVNLPKDFRDFFSATDGFLFEWKLLVGDANSDECVLGKVQLNSLSKVSRIYGYETTNDSGIKCSSGRYEIRLAPESKVFELSPLYDRGKVALIYLYPNHIPTIWLVTSTTEFHFLATNLATYLRMAIAHLGIPNWQLAYTPEGLPVWSQNVCRLIAPNLLSSECDFERKIEKPNKNGEEDIEGVKLNKLDPDIFTRPLRSLEEVAAELLPSKLSKREVKTSECNRKTSKKPNSYKLQEKLLKFLERC